tara:strand:+ start:615 stop:1517 length:903 start_codon:yes stop_codon:yes gene_type:complete
MITIGSLFSGIGGFELGLERAIPGSKTIWQVEQDAFCQKVLQKHWPDAKIYDDVVGVGAHNLEPVDVLCGGFPCQGISNAGKKEGLEDERSGLWWEMLRVISELQPRVVVLENVAALFIRGIPEVLGSLAENGYDAEWTIVSAAECGAPHRRDRVFIVAYPVCIGRVERERLKEKIQPSQFARLQREESQQPIVSKSIHSGNEATTNTNKNRCGQTFNGRINQKTNLSRRATSIQQGRSQKQIRKQSNYWRTPAPQPTIRRTHDGFPNRVDQLRALGNAIVPQCSEWVGRRIMESGLLCD